MLKNPLLAYIMGHSGLVASDTTKVCCSVARASFSSCDTLGSALSYPETDSPDVLVDSAPPPSNEFRTLSPSQDSFPPPPLALAVIPPPPIDLKLLSPTSDFTTSPHSAALSAMLAFSVMIPPDDDSPFPVLDLSAEASLSKAIHLLISSLLLLVEPELLFAPTSGLSPAPVTGFSTS
ncbi:hypothetical protein TorRG33x02_337130 [Trema orientale]|uniref:Uncharacterized protein n=1 Tax=Trema orientale TaxID=63057 RepID=A0A2P5AZ83_TREOI|nr:hypothetical protein TorRG33x02_337130 [Trema orientale]